MHLDDVKHLFRYDRWANRQMLDSVRQLDISQFSQGLTSSYGSVRDTLVHILTGEWIWLERWLGNSPKAMLDPQDFPDLKSVERALEKVEKRREAFLDGLNEDDLTRSVAYVNTEGQTWEYPLGRMLQHLVNHSTYHRGQVATLLRQLGATPNPTDFLWFVDES